MEKGIHKGEAGIVDFFFLLFTLTKSRMTSGKHHLFSFKVFAQFIQASYNLENG